jgi:integrase
VSAKSNQTRRSRKLVPPPKPYDDFPLGYHQSGKFQKSYRENGQKKVVYFGAWAKREGGKLVPVADGGWRQALEEYEAWKAKQDLLEREATALKAKADNEQARVEEERVAVLEANASDRLTLLDFCDLFLDFKYKQMERKDLERVTYDDYVCATELLLEQFGNNKAVEELGANDFADLRTLMAKKWNSPSRVGKFITMTGTIFKTAFKAGWIERIPNYGHDFSKPSKKRAKKYKDEGGDKLFTRDEVHALLRATIDGAWSVNKQGKRIGTGPSTQMRAMIFLGINCGFGNKDVGTLPLSAIDLKNRLIKFPRPKTGVDRECPLWPETVKAIEDVIAERRDTKCKTLFVTKYDRPWHREKVESDSETVPGDDAVKRIFSKLLKALHINGRRNIGFYSLRHTFATVAMELDDRDAVKAIMGHSDPEMLARYNHGQVPLKRRQAVASHVRRWLAWAEKTPGKPR